MMLISQLWCTADGMFNAFGRASILSLCQHLLTIRKCRTQIVARLSLVLNRRLNPGGSEFITHMIPTARWVH